MVLPTSAVPRGRARCTRAGAARYSVVFGGEIGHSAISSCRLRPRSLRRFAKSGLKTRKESRALTMSETLVVPREALPYLLLQRTGYLVIPSAPLLGSLFRLVNRTPLRDLGPWSAAARFEALVRPAQVIRAYEQDLRREMEAIQEILPERCDRVMDIGCGLAGIDILLGRHYAARGQTPRFTLVDRTHSSHEIYYGFKNEAAFYNSLLLTQRMVEANGLTPDRYSIHDVGDNPSLTAEANSTDLVISLISWG